MQRLGIAILIVETTSLTVHASAIDVDWVEAAAATFSEMVVSFRTA